LNERIAILEPQLREVGQNMADARQSGISEGTIYEMFGYSMEDLEWQLAELKELREKRLRTLYVLGLFIVFFFFFFCSEM
jgi:hypothetical protein